MSLIGDILDSRVNDLTKKALDIDAQRTLLINSNIANAEVPGYKAVDFKPFEDELKQAYENKMPMAQTNAGHMGGLLNNLGTYMPEVVVSEAPGRIDGNNVNLDKEVANLSETSTMYSAIVTARGKRGRIISDAIDQAK